MSPRGTVSRCAEGSHRRGRGRQPQGRIQVSHYLTLQLQPNVLFRHRVLGFFGAGDLVVRTGGPHAEVSEWPNVLFVRSRLKRIEHLLQSREVVPENT